jgi:hypothetical protein
MKKEQIYDIHYDAIRPDSQSIWWLIQKWQSGYIRCTEKDIINKRWSKIKQNKFIESIFTRIPISGVYFTEDIKTGNLTVVEGKQRLMTIIDFYFSLYKYRLVSRYEELDGKTFKELAPVLQNRFEDTSFRFYVIQAQTSEELVRDILHRIKQ